jgi:hypothetical protein
MLFCSFQDDEVPVLKFSQESKFVIKALLESCKTKSMWARLTCVSGLRSFLFTFIRFLSEPLDLSLGLVVLAPQVLPFVLPSAPSAKGSQTTSCILSLPRYQLVHVKNLRSSAVSGAPSPWCCTQVFRFPKIMIVPDTKIPLYLQGLTTSARRTASGPCWHGCPSWRTATRAASSW